MFMITFLDNWLPWVGCFALSALVKLIVKVASLLKKYEYCAISEIFLGSELFLAQCTVLYFLFCCILLFHPSHLKNTEMLLCSVTRNI